jgi:hypothetical protein
MAERFLSPDAPADTVVHYGARIAFVERVDGLWRVVIDGQAQEAFEAVDLPTFWRGRVAYKARHQGRCFVFLDGERIEEADDISVLQVAGEDLLFAMRDGGKIHLCNGRRKTGPFDEIDGPLRHHPVVRREGRMFFVHHRDVLGPYDEIARYLASPDGKRVALAVRFGDRWHVDADGKRSRDYDEVGPIFWTTDFAWSAKSGGKWRVVDGGAEGPAYDWVWSFHHPPLAYAAQEGGKFHLVLGDRRFGPFDQATPYSERLFTAEEGGRARVFVDGAPGEAFKGVGDPWFDEGVLRYDARGDDGQYLVTDGKKEGPFERAWRQGRNYHVIKAGKRHLVRRGAWSRGYDDIREAQVEGFFQAAEGGQWFAVSGEREGERFDELLHWEPSPDGKSIAYAGRRGGEWFVVAGEAKAGPFTAVGRPFWNGDRVGFGANDEEELWWRELP